MIESPLDETLLLAEPESPPIGDARVEGMSLGRRVLRPRTLASFLVALAVIGIALSRFNLNLGDVLRESSRANPWYLLAAFAVYYGSFFLRALRWRGLLENARVQPAADRCYPGTLGFSTIYLLSWFVNCLVPAKLGDAYRAYSLRQRSGVPFTGALGTIFAERLADLVVLGALLVVSAFVVFGRHMPQSVTNWVYVATGLGIALIVGLAGVWRFRHRLRALVPERFSDHYVRLEEGALGSFARLPQLGLLTIVIWLLEGLRFYFVGLSLHAGVPFAAALFVALLVSLLTAVPITPAGLGVVELGVVGTLALLNVVETTAASMALLDRLVAYWSVLVIGGLAYLVVRWVWPVSADSRLPAHSDARRD